jgi:SNF2 family DNA or RNA helicase
MGSDQVNVEIRENEIRIETDKPTAAKLGAHFIKGNIYKLPKTIDAVSDLRRFTPDDDVGNELSKLRKSMIAKRDVLMQQKKRQGTYGNLRPYQAQDLNFLRLLPNAGIFNEQRTGKTPTTISLMKFKKFKRIIIVCPAGLALNWQKEWDKWHGEVKATVIKGNKTKRAKLYQTLSEQESFALIVSYDTLKLGYKDTSDNHVYDEVYTIRKNFGMIDALVIDEAHYIRHRKSLRTIAVKTLGGYAKHRYALTGTPAVKDGYDIWSILNFLYPNKFTSYWQFLERYFEMKEDMWSKTKQPTGKYIRKEALEDILGMISTNRKRAEVMDWLPDKQYTTIPIELTPKQNKVYEKVRDEFEYEENGELLIDCPSHLAQLTRLRQVCLAPSILKIKAPSAKEEFLVEWLQNNSEPVIIFSNFTGYLKELRETLNQKLKEEVVMIHGEMGATHKQQSVELFQKGEARILLANIIAAGTGYTLDRATTTIFLDKAWNPTDNLQAEDRMVPTSKERNHKMDVISLVAEDTYDEVIDKLLEHKYDITSVINNGGIKALERLYRELN